MCDFKPGDEVVCVDDGGLASGALKMNARYCVDAVSNSIPDILLDVGVPAPGTSVGWWDSKRFRRSDAAVERLKSLCDDPGKLFEKTHAERVAGMQEEFRTAMRSMFGEWGDVE